MPMMHDAIIMIYSNNILIPSLLWISCLPSAIYDIITRWGLKVPLTLHCIVLFDRSLPWPNLYHKLLLQPVASTRDTVPYFGSNGQHMILCFWPPFHPLSKLLAIQGHAQTLEEQLWMGVREVSIISHGSVTSSDLKHKRLFFRESVSTFLQLVVAYNPWAKTSS